MDWKDHQEKSDDVGPDIVARILSQSTPDEFEHKTIGGERQLRKVVEIEEVRRRSIVSRLEHARHAVADKPDADRLPFGSPEIGVRVQNLVDFDDQAGLL